MAVKGRKTMKKPAKAKVAAPKKKSAAKARKAKKAPARKAAPAPKKPVKRAARMERRQEPRDSSWKQVQTLRRALEQSGKPLTHWVDILDRVGGPELGHTTLVRILTETQKVAPWPANCIVLNYRGLYGFGEAAALMDHQDELDKLGQWK